MQHKMFIKVRHDVSITSTSSPFIIISLSLSFRYIHCLADIHSFIALNNEFAVFKDVMKNILVMHVTYILWIIDVKFEELYLLKLCRAVVRKFT